MPIKLACDCGRALNLREEYAGKRIKCPECKSILTVPNLDAIEEAVQVVRPISSPPPRPSNPDSERPRPRRRDRDDDDDDRPRKKKRKSATSDPMLRDYYRHLTPRRERGSSIAISRTVISGALMMIGAVVWFVVGLFAGWIFFYPPVLFIAGLVTFVAGLMGYERD
jgi:hypothetical protein